MANETSTKATETSLKAQLLKLAVEVGPLLVFFLVNARAGIFWNFRNGCSGLGAPAGSLIATTSAASRASRMSSSGIMRALR